MISLYLSHIPHILHIFSYSSISIYSPYSCIDISIGSACCPATCFFHFFSSWGRLCFSCGFLVSVLWMVFVPPFVSFIVPLLVSFLAPSFVSLLGPFCPFRPSLRFSACPAFRLFVWAYRRGGSCGGVWGGAVGLSSGVARWRGVCRVRRFCQLVFVGACGCLGFLSVLLVWRLVCSARFGGVGGAFPGLLASGTKCSCGVVSSRFSSRFSSRVVVSFVSF